ncbi:MAG: bacillithiol biosynthesis protein BshC, partial [Ginsengibacter sp.]
MQKEFQSEYIPYKQTGKFTSIVLDYISGAPSLKEFYNNPVSIEGVEQAIEARKNFPTDRRLLVEGLQKQYESINNADTVFSNIS